MPAERMQEVHMLLMLWSMAAAVLVALGAGYSGLRSTNRKSKASAPRWSDFFLVSSGRTTRRALWLGFVVPFIAALTFAVAWESPYELPKASFAVLGLSVWPAVAVGTKRFHDRDKSGWFLLLFVIPILGQLWLLIELGFLPGTLGPNRFGPEAAN